MTRLRTATVALVALLLWPAALGLAQPAGSPGNPAVGSRVFETKGCAACHAIGGAGGAIGPDLGRVPRLRPFYSFAAAMWNHLPRMAEPAWRLDIPRPYLAPREMDDLVAFLASLDIIGGPAGPGDPDRGRRLVRDRGCLRCHSVSGEGGRASDLTRVKGPETPGGALAALWNHAFVMAPEARLQRIEWPWLTPEEMADLMAFLNHRGPKPN